MGPSALLWAVTRQMIPLTVTTLQGHWEVQQFGLICAPHSPFILGWLSTTVHPLGLLHSARYVKLLLPVRSSKVGCQTQTPL